MIVVVSEHYYIAPLRQRRFTPTACCVRASHVIKYRGNATIWKFCVSLSRVSRIARTRVCTLFYSYYVTLHFLISFYSIRLQCSVLNATGDRSTYVCMFLSPSKTRLALRPYRSQLLTKLSLSLNVVIIVI